MSSNPQLEDQDLALYAMGLLAEPEASAVERAVAESDAVRQRLAAVLELLAAYGEASVELQTAPEGSLGRLMDRIAQDKQAPASATVAVPVAGPSLVKTSAPRRAPRAAEWLAWIGWAVAAVLVIAVGKLEHDRTALNASLTAQKTQAAQASAQAAQASAQAQQASAMAAQTSAQAAQATTQAAQASHQAQQASTQAANAAQQRDALQANATAQQQRIQQLAAQNAIAQNNAENLRSTVTAQSNQVAQLSTDAATAREILAALTDTTALRVTLTKPKSHVVPIARAAYVERRGTLVFLASNLAPLKPNKVYQLWLLPASGASPVPAGTFAPDAQGNASLLYANFPHAVPAKGFAVTIENAGGAQTPTLPLILAGAASAS